MMKRPQPRDPTARAGKKWNQVARAFKERCRLRGERCWLCPPDGPPIEYDAAPYAHLGFELDHAQSVSDRPDLMWIETNFRASHRSCNRSRGARAPQQDPNPPSPFGTWVKPSLRQSPEAEAAALRMQADHDRRRGLRPPPGAS